MSGEAKPHASVQLYWVFCVILCAITFVEWLVFKKRVEWGISAPLMISGLLAMSLVKFIMVVGWYMHLRYDHSWLKYVFVGGLVMGSGTAVALCILM